MASNANQNTQRFKWLNKETKGHSTETLTRESVHFIEYHVDKPFFLYVAYYAVHSPLQGANAFMKKFSHVLNHP